MRRTITSLAAAAAALAITASASAATLPHTHKITTGNGDEQQIAGGLCHARWEKAGENFHEHVHVGIDPDAGQGGTITRNDVCAADE